MSGCSHLRPTGSKGYRHASGSLAAVGALDHAIAHAIKASDLAPENAEFALHAGCLLLDAGALEEAVAFPDRAVAIEPRKQPRLARAVGRRCSRSSGTTRR